MPAAVAGRSMKVMTTNQIRASDAEREEVARVVQAAGAEGRLTLAEAEERLAGVYAAQFRHELGQFTADLPAVPVRPGRPYRPGRERGPLAVHAAIVVVLATVLIIRWLVSGVPFFWPVFPLFWLTVSLVLHAWIRGWRPGGSVEARS
jgi:hypothetical protein